jgi:hypothetical protein
MIVKILFFLLFCINITLLVSFIPIDSATSQLSDWLFQVSPESRSNAIIIGWVSRPQDCVKRLCKEIVPWRARRRPWWWWWC